MIQRESKSLTDQIAKDIVKLRQEITDPKDMSLVIHFKAIEDLVDSSKGVRYGLVDHETGKSHDWDSLPELDDNKVSILMYMMKCLLENVIKPEHYYRWARKQNLEEEINILTGTKEDTDEKECT